MTTMNDATAAEVLKACGWPDNTIITAIAIGHAESGLNTNAVNKDYNKAGKWTSTDFGWMQVNRPVTTLVAPDNLFDPYANARAALSIWRVGGFARWTTYRSGAYLKYVNQVTIGIPTESANGGPDTLQQIADSGPADAVVGAASSALDVGTELARIADIGAKTAAWVANPHNWIRIIEVIGGGALVLYALKALGDSGAGPVAQAASAVTAPVAQAASAAKDTAKGAAAAALA